MIPALKQYIDLYNDHAALINRGSAPLFNDLREAAADMLRLKGLPAKGEENYQHTSLADILAPDFGLNLDGVPVEVNPAASFHCDVPRLSSQPFICVNDTYLPAPEDIHIPEGVYAGPLLKAPAAASKAAARHYAKIADLANPLVALDTLLCQDAFLLYVPEGIRIEQPLQLVNIFQSGIPLMGVRRMLVIIEDEAEARLLVCDHTQNPEQTYLSLQTVEIYVGRNARFDLYDMEESTEKTSRLSSLYLMQEEGSNAVIDGITLFNGTTRNEYYCRFRGRGAELNLLGLAIEDRRRHLDTFSLISHNVPECHSNELFKYVADDEARAIFSGRIFVADGAVKSEAYQSNRSVLGSADARVYSKPQLEIYNDDVKCSHGCAIGSLDEKQIFYMRTRGLDLEEAKMLLKQAFMADVIDGVRIDALKERLTHLVARRFAGEDSACASCGRAGECN